MITLETKKSIGSFVAEDYRTAAVFQKYKIDFCCKGGKTIEEVCIVKNIPAKQLLNELENTLHNNDKQSIDFKTWPLDLLIDYIIKKHHRYIEQTAPVLVQYLNKLCKVHGANHPELFKIREEFTASAEELMMHMKKEEGILFPFIVKLITARKTNEELIQPGFGSVQNPIQMMMQEHEIEGDRFVKIAELSNNYAPPADACSTYKVAFSLLKEFENDLHYHIHLENNILFPKAVEMEVQFVGEIVNG